MTIEFKKSDNLTSDIIIVDGIWGSGKSLLNPIINNMIEDINNKVLRTPLDPSITFLDDPLRILRCWRFSVTKEFSIHPSCWEAMKNPEILEKLEKVVSKERIREELYKMFKINTIKSIKILDQSSMIVPDLYSIIFSNGLWLKPTFEL